MQEEDDRRSNDYNHSDDDPLRVHRSLSHSVAVQRVLQQRREAAGRLLTVPFRSVDEYLDKLQLCSQALHDSGLTLCYTINTALQRRFRELQ